MIERTWWVIERFARLAGTSPTGTSTNSMVTIAIAAPCLGAAVAIPTAQHDAASVPRPRPIATRAAGNVVPHAPMFAAAPNAPAMISVATNGISATILPVTIDHRGIGRDHRYAAVLSSSSSASDDAT